MMEALSFLYDRKAKRWYKLTIGSRQGDWEALCSSFCLNFFPISRLVNLRSEVLSFKQEEKESLGMAWECFNALINTGPNLAIQDPILLQHFYMGLDRKTSKHLDAALGGSFLHVSANSGRSILEKILENTHEEVEKKLLEEEPQITNQNFCITHHQLQLSQIPNHRKRRKLQFWISCLNSMMNFLMNMETP